MWLQRLKAKDLLAVAGEYDDFPIVLETYRECLEEFLAIDAARELLEGLRDGSVQAVEVRRDTPSPFVASLLFDFQALYMYEWDRPKNIGRGATEAQQRLVADLVGHLRSATALLDPRTIAEREGRLQGTAPDARARTPAEFLELLRRLGDLPADGEAVSARYVGDAEALLRGLCADRLVVQVRLPSAEPLWHWILTEEWGLYDQAFRRSDVQALGRSGAGEVVASAELRVRVDGDREVALEEAVPALFRGEDEGEEEAEVRREEARRSIVRRFALRRMLTSAAEVAGCYGLTEGEAETILRDLESLGALVSIPGEGQAESLTSSHHHPPALRVPVTSSPTRWASPEHLEGAYAATLARRRREARPATVAQYQQFLLGWQHRVGTPLVGEEGVREVLAQLQGLPLPATVWEGEVLARRVKPYQGSWLDHACQTGEFVWQGSPGAFGGRGRVAFFEREIFPHWPADRGFGVRNTELGVEGDGDEPNPTLRTPHSELRTRVAEVLARRGASFLLDLALATGSDSRAVAAALWELIWQGLVAHDQWSVIRAGPPASGVGSSFGEALGGRLSGRAPGQRPHGRLPRPQFSSIGRGQRETLPGRYSWLPALRFEEPGEEERGTWRSDVADLVARQLLERYGVVARELLELEAIPLPWGLLYDALHLMELTGEIQRGYFVEGFTGAQFGLPRAVEELKKRQEGREPRAASYVLLNACDPASVYGGAARVPEPEEGEEERSLVRLPSNYLVLQDGAPALLLETGARRLSSLRGLAGEELEAACAALRDLVEHPWPLRTVRQLRLERWGERPIRGSEAEAPLRALGFSLSPKGLEL